MGGGATGPLSNEGGTVGSIPRTGALLFEPETG